MTRKLQVEDLLAFELAGDVQISPAGDRVAYVVKRVNQEKNSYETAIYMAAGSQAPVRFTGGDSDSAPQFSPDGSHLAFISRRSGQAQIWVLAVAGGEARQVTRVQGGVEEFAWAPDGERLAFTAMLKADGIQPEKKEEEKETDLLAKHTKKVKVITEYNHKLDGVGYFGDRRPCLCVTSLAEDAQPVQLTRPPYLVSDFVWAPDGRRIFFCSRMGEDYDRSDFEMQLYAISAEGGEAQLLSPEGLLCEGATPAVSPDGTKIAFQAVESEQLGYDNYKLYTMPVTGGAVTRLAKGFDRPFGSQAITDMPAPAKGKLTWAPDGSFLYSLASIDGSVHLVRVEIASGEVKPLTHGERMVYAYSIDGSGRKAALAYADTLSPTGIYALDLREGSEQRLDRLNEPLLADLELSEPRRYAAQAAGGPAVDSWVMKPHGFKEGEKYPAILWIHGGPMAMFATTFFFELQLLAAQGYGIVYCNPRGSVGYGEKFCGAIAAEWGNLDYQDLMAALDQALAENPWIDADRLGVTGGSYGGYMTNWIVGHTDRFKAAVTGRSICDMRLMAGTGDVGTYWIRRVGVAPWVDDTVYKQQSPITYVENVTTPILIEHQEGDLRCPLDQGMTWYTAIKYLNKAPVRFVRYPEEFHGMSRTGKPWNRIHRLKEVTAWFAKYL